MVPVCLSVWRPYGRNVAKKLWADVVSSQFGVQFWLVCLSTCLCVCLLPTCVSLYWLPIRIATWLPAFLSCLLYLLWERIACPTLVCISGLLHSISTLSNYLYACFCGNLSVQMILPAHLSTCSSGLSQCVHLVCLSVHLFMPRLQTSVWPLALFMVSPFSRVS